METDELAPLVRGVERLVDADLILPEEGESLLAALVAARHGWETRDLAATFRHLRRFVQELETIRDEDGGLETEAGAALEAVKRLGWQDCAPDRRYGVWE